MKRVLQAAVGLFLLWLVFRQAEWPALAAAFALLDPYSIAAALALFFLAWGVAALKWQLLWPRATWWQLFRASIGAQAYALLLPGQIAGEVVKVYRVGRYFSDTTGVAASVLVDRATGLLSLLLLASGGIALARTSTPADAVLLLALSGLAVAALLYTSSRRSLLSGASSAVERFASCRPGMQPMSRAATRFLEAWSTYMANPLRIALAVAIGVVFQALAVAINFVIATALGINVGFAEWCWILGIVSLALLLPITIAGIGVREGLYIGLLGLLSVPIEKALAVSLIVFAVSLVGAAVGALLEFEYALRARERVP